MPLKATVNVDLLRMSQSRDYTHMSIYDAFAFLFFYRNDIEEITISWGLIFLLYTAIFLIILQTSSMVHDGYITFSLLDPQR